MNFNVNFLGHIPYNPDNLHKPVNEKKDGKPPLPSLISSGRLLSFSLRDMMRMYWTVKSFKISVTAQVTDTINPLDQFLAAGGNQNAIIGAIAGLGAISSPRSGGVAVKGYTKIFSKYTKRVRKSREGIINGITSPLFKDLQNEFLDLDDEIDPNRLESHIYRPNEGTLCSAGPVHIFEQGTVSVILDFSDIIYFSLRPTGTRFYWPKVTIFIGVPGLAAASFGNQIQSKVIFQSGSVGIGRPLSFINLSFPGSADNLAGSQINSQLYSTQIANVNIDIRSGDRCCDRFFWDGKDKDIEDPENKKFREKDSETKTPKENSADSCEDVCGDTDPDPSKGLTGGVYLKRAKKEDEYSRPGGQL